MRSKEYLGPHYPDDNWELINLGKMKGVRNEKLSLP